MKDREGTTDQSTAGSSLSFNCEWLKETSLDLPPVYVNMSPVEPAYEQVIDGYTRRMEAQAVAQ